MRLHNLAWGALRARFLILFLSGLFLISSCQKKDISAKNANDRKTPVWVYENLKKIPTTLTIPINQQIPAVFLNKVGNEYPKNFWNYDTTSFNRLLSIPCDPFEDDFEDNVFYAQNLQILFYGYNTEGFAVEAEFWLSTGFEIQDHESGNPSKPTSGRIRVKDLATSNILHTFSDLPLTYEEIGPDPSNPDKTQYKLKFRTPLINDPNVDILNIFLESRPIVYTDCEEVAITTSTWNGISFGFLDVVCSRTDNVGIQPAGLGQVYISGCNALLSYPSGLTVPHEQEVEYDDGSGWTRFSFPTNSCTQTDNLFPTDVHLKSVSPGVVKFRWRNIEHDNNTCYPDYAVQCSGPMFEISMVVP